MEIVHEATKIPMDALRSIEEGYSVKMLTPFYYRGFLKIYAEFLGLDVEEVFKQYGFDKKSSPVAASPVKPVAPAIIKKSIPTKIKQPMPQADVIKNISSIVTAQQMVLIVKIAVIFLVLFLVFKMVGCTVHVINNKLKAQKIQTKKEQKKPDQKTIKKIEKIEKIEKPEPILTMAVDAVGPDKIMDVKSHNQKVSLAVRVSKDTWIRVKSDDKVVFESAMRKGSMESWEAKNDIELSGKNINELEMEVNGKHIGSLGNGERRAKKILINKDGLTVKK